MSASLGLTNQVADTLSALSAFIQGIPSSIEELHPVRDGSVLVCKAAAVVSSPASPAGA